MSSDALRDRIVAELSGPLADLGLDVEAVEITPAGKRRVLRVAVDKDGGVTMDDVAEATREVSRALDDAGVMGERAYTLEVTSPGVDRPLTLPRHWRRNAGRMVHVRLAGGGEVSGRVAATTDERVVVRTESGERSLAYDDIDRALVQVELNRPSEEA